MAPQVWAAAEALEAAFWDWRVENQRALDLGGTGHPVRLLAALFGSFSVGPQVLGLPRKPQSLCEAGSGPSRN